MIIQQHISSIAPHTIGVQKAALQRSSQGKVFRKYAANLQESTHAKVRFSKIALLLCILFMSRKQRADRSNNFSNPGFSIIV